MSGVRRRHWKPVKRTNPSGRTVWKARHPWGHAGTFAREWQAQEAINRAYAEHERIGAPTTLAEYAAMWTARHPRSERTNATNDHRVGRALGVEVEGRPLGDWKLSDLRRRHAAELAAVLLAQGRAMEGVRGILRALSALAEDAVTDEVAGGNPFRGLRLSDSDPRVRREPRRARIWTFEQMHAFAAAAGPHEPMVRTLADCGLRAGELLALRRGDQDLRAGTFAVRGTAWNGRIVGSSRTKRHDRTGPIPPGCLALLRVMPVRIDSPWMFPTPGGGAREHPGGLLWRYDNWRRDVWVPAQDVSGMDPTPQEFRHSYVSHLRASGVDPADLADVAGHSLEVATARYTHALGRSFDAIREAIG